MQQDRLDRQAQLERQALLLPFPARQVQLDPQAQLGLRGLLARRLQLLAQPDPQVQQVQQAQRVRIQLYPAQRVLLVLQGHKAFKAILDQRVHKAFKVFKAFKGHKALLAQQVHKVFKAFRVILVLRGQQVQLVQLDCKARQEPRVHKAYKV